MNKYRKWAFPLLELSLYVSFLAADLGRFADATWLKFATICLCALTAVLGANSRDGRFVAVAQCLTVAADWHLLMKSGERAYLAGVGLFLLAQWTYMFRIRALRGRFTPAGLLFRTLGLLGALVPLQSGNWLTALVVVYFSNLVGNLLETLNLSERSFALGLALFVCCDVCVGLWNLELHPALTEFARVGMWLFYLPSQVLIVLSAHRDSDMDPRKGEVPP